jgi:hypothetical protein
MSKSKPTGKNMEERELETNNYYLQTQTKSKGLETRECQTSMYGISCRTFMILLIASCGIMKRRRQIRNNASQNGATDYGNGSAM